MNYDDIKTNLLIDLLNYYYIVPKKTNNESLDSLILISSSNLNQIDQEFYLISLQITINKTQINALRSYNKDNAKGTEQYVFNGEHKSDNGTGVIYYVSPILGKSEYMTKVGGCNNKACGR